LRALWYRIIYSPIRILRFFTYRIWRTQLRISRIKNVDIPYKKKMKQQKQGRRK